MELARLLGVHQTNISNTIGTVRRVSRNVKRWKDGSMARRWTAAGLLTAQKRFRRIKGYRDMPILKKALRGNDVDLTEKVA